MDRHQTHPTVLARIPHIKASSRERTRERLPSSSGRLIGQALSFRVLAGVTLLLFAVAILPHSLGFIGRRPDSSAVVQVVPEKMPDAIAPSANAVAERSPAAANAQTSVPVPASPPPISVARRPEQIIAESSPPPTEAPSMSEWPNPAHPITLPKPSVDQPQTGATPTTAIRLP
jgi:hypothetical protein